MPENGKRTFALVVDDDDAGKRLDSLIASTFHELSRTLAGRLVRDGLIRVNDHIKKPSFRVNPAELISGIIPSTAPLNFKPEPIDIDILFEDDACLVINKKPGIVVHPSPGHESGTLANGLIYHCPEIAGVGGVPTRPGIVHRLDKDTSGVMVIAKTQSAFHHLAIQFKDRSIHKSYLGFVFGVMPENGQIILPIGRHTADRKKMSATNFNKSRDAQTYWHVIKQFDRIALVEFTIKTGRTHQIRVHCAAIKHPIVGDLVYGIKKPQNLFSDSPELAGFVKKIPRQFLHAWRLSFSHPSTGKTVAIEAPLPEDMQLFQENILKQS
jgi:23S rRNA pseudouridine1911/1915/1917 synthase